MHIRQDDLTSAATRDLVRLHLEGMRAGSPPEAVFALDLSGLTAPGVTLWTAWEDETILGMGALKRHDAGLAELKSMRTHPDHLRKGVAAALLEHLINEARAAGVSRLCLETGSGPAFEPALGLYRRRGFTPCGPFADYEKSEFNQFFELRLG